jgi:hypothetical protein
LSPIHSIFWNVFGIVIIRFIFIYEYYKFPPQSRKRFNLSISQKKVIQLFFNSRENPQKKEKFLNRFKPRNFRCDTQKPQQNFKLFKIWNIYKYSIFYSLNLALIYLLIQVFFCSRSFLSIAQKNFFQMFIFNSLKLFTILYSFLYILLFLFFYTV